MKVYKINRCPFIPYKVDTYTIPVFVHKDCLIFRSEMELNLAEHSPSSFNYYALTRYWKARPMLYRVLKCQFINEERILTTVLAKTGYKSPRLK